MTWIDFRIEKPKTDICALVCNEKGWMFDVKAMYHLRNDVWQLDDPTCRGALLLDITHYLPIPSFKIKN